MIDTFGIQAFRDIVSFMGKVGFRYEDEFRFV